MCEILMLDPLWQQEKGYSCNSQERASVVVASEKWISIPGGPVNRNESGRALHA